jgi:hypothetical protein
MRRGRVVFVVGHAHWGKSTTLRALTQPNPQRRYIEIGEDEFFIRRMSNDDRPKEFYKFMGKVKPSNWPALIVAFCPVFDDPRTSQCLKALRRKRYRPFFWVLRWQYGGTRFITPEEIATLRNYGQVKIYGVRHAEAHARAIALRRFIQNTVLS